MNEQEKVFDDARVMFNTDGWKTLMQDLQASLDNITVEAIDDEKGFWIAKGQVNILRSLLGYENMMKAAEADAEENDETYI